MNIGTFGSGKDKVTFTVRRKKILSYRNMTKEGSVNYDEHPRYKKKPYMEFTGQGIDTLSLEIIAKREFGVNPLALQKKLEKLRDNGKAGYFVQGKKKIGKNRWVIQTINTTYEEYLPNGRPSELHIAVTMNEYPYKKSAAKKSSTKNSKGKTKAEKKSGGTSTKAKKTNYTLYTVKNGDTLWALAQKYYKQGSKYTRIFSANQDGAEGTAIVKDPNRIYPGWLIKIPS